jgi:hypothetical protein
MQINLVELDLASLQKLGGGAAFAQITRLLEEAVEDMDRRPQEKRARVIDIKLHLKPKTRLESLDENTHRTVLDGVNLAIEMDLRRPKRKTLEYDLGVSDGNKIFFNPDDAFNHRQAPLPFVEGEVTAVRDVVPMHAG